MFRPLRSAFRHALPALAASALALSAAPALAHPHIWIDAKATLVFDDAGALSAIRHAWTFDRAFSVWSIQGLDADGDGVVTTEEMQDLADENMYGLSQYDFYTYVGIGERTADFPRGVDPTLTYENERTTLRFEVQAEPAFAFGNALEIAINDPEYYVAINFAGIEDVEMENAPEGCTLSMTPPRELDPDLAGRLFELPPEVTELPPDLAVALRGVQGAINVACPGAPLPAETALEATEQMASARPAPFGGPPPEPGLALPRTGVLGWIADQQTAFYGALTEALSRLSSDFNAFWVLGGLSFLYGVFHAAGPGHGKVVISSYVLANEGEARRGIVLSFAAALVQSLVAIGFVLVAAAALNLTSTAMSTGAHWIGIASYGLLAALGLWLVLRKIFGWGHHHHGHDHHRHDHHDHAGHHHHHHEDEPHMHHAVAPAQARGDWREQLAVVLGVGARPCTGALVVLVFALSQGLLAAGIVSVLLMGLGTAITVATLAVIAISAKGLARRFTGMEGGVGTTIFWWVELLAAAAVFLLGVLMLLASL
ncbi:DUF1007 family protein [Arsenicitalea aurantiaca]|uniref:HoxN/HupN/NixA family nickel/cobalt transporter n=1 Tax=Arsenicitalea aurantiaca TaxID=1783274 RepID=UPI00186512A3|nr:DUF1007 family protein [Arsenicitalea aurantiaca]